MGVDGAQLLSLRRAASERLHGGQMTHHAGFTRGARIGISAAALLLMATLDGCAVNSEMTNLWHDTSLSPGSIHNVFVVAIRKDPVRRRAWEDAFVKELTARGVTATSSFRLYADAPPDTDQVIEAVRKNGYDAVLVSTRLPDQETSRQIEGAVRREQMTSQDYYGNFHSYWVTVHDPAYTETDRIIQVQTDIWSTGGDGGHLVWSATLRTLESMSRSTVAKTVAKDIMPVMEKQGLVAKQDK